MVNSGFPTPCIHGVRLCLFSLHYDGRGVSLCGA